MAVDTFVRGVPVTSFQVILGSTESTLGTSSAGPGAVVVPAARALLYPWVYVLAYYAEVLAKEMYPSWDHRGRRFRYCQDHCCSVTSVERIVLLFVSLPRPV